MLPNYTYALSNIERELLCALVLNSTNNTFETISVVLEDLVLSRPATRQDLHDALLERSNCYVYHILWRLRNNREVRHIKRLFVDKMLNLRFRFVILDVLVTQFHHPQSGALQHYKEDEIVMKGTHWFDSYEAAMRDKDGFKLVDDRARLEDNTSVRHRVLAVEALCTCQRVSCLQDDMMLETICEHAFNHTREAALTHFDGHCGKIIKYTSCSRFSSMKKTFVMCSPFKIIHKAMEHYIYCLPRADVWFYSTSPNMEEAFEIWNFGKGTAEKCDIVYC